MKTNRIKFCLAAIFAVVIFFGVKTAASGRDIRISNLVANIIDANLLGSDTNDVPITIQFMDMPLDKVDPTDHTVHNAPLVSLHWENITIRQAIVALCKNYDLVIVKDSATSGARIKPKD
jgi:hypothetical protein